MADVSALALRTSSNRSMSVSFTSANVADTLTFANLSALLSAAVLGPQGLLPSSAIKSFLDATRGSVPLTIAALGDNGVAVSVFSSTATASPVQVSADKTFAGFAAGDYVLRLSLSSTISA